MLYSFHCLFWGNITSSVSDINSSILFLPLQLDILKHQFPAFTGVRCKVADIAGDVGLLIEVGEGDDALTFDLEFETADAVDVHHLTLTEMMEQEL